MALLHLLSMLYYLTGDDEFAAEQAVIGLRTQHQITPLHYSRLRFEGDVDALLDAIIGACTLTLDGGQQLLWVQDLSITSSLPRAAQIQSLLTPLADPNEGSIIVLSGGNSDGRLALTKWLQAHAECRDYNRPALWETEKLIAQAQAQAVVHGLRLTHNCAEALIAQVGNDTRSLHQAIELLELYGDQITPELVERLVPAQASNGITFSRALLYRDVPTAMAELERTVLLNESPLRLIALTLSQVRLWLGVKAAVSQSPYADNGSIARMIDLPGNPNRVYHLKQEVAQTSLKALVGLLRLILATEKALKSGSDETAAMRQLVLAVGKV